MESIRRRQAMRYVARFAAGGIGNYIDGQALPACRNDKDVIDPSTGQTLTFIADARPDEVDAAVSSSQRAFAIWRRTSGPERQAMLHRIANLIEARAEEIAAVECLDTGQAWRYMAKAALRGAENFRYFADQAPAASNGLSLPSADHVNFTGRQPIGPVAVITPWNTPFMLSTWKIAPALAAGCTVVHKPAEWSPLSARLLAEICSDAQLPDGVFNSINGFGETTGRRLTEHSDIKAIAFVGESQTGSAIMAQGAATLKRVHFELGGKNPILVFEDADLDAALDAVVFMIYSLNGERCTSSSRLLIQRSISRDFIERLAQRVERLKVGDPFDPETEVGPLIHASHLEKVLSYVAKAREDGATVRVGGERMAGHGCYFRPVLFTDARPGMRIAREEIFGPALTVMEFETEAEAVAVANDVAYGLAAYVWTSNLSRGLRVSDAIDAGMIWVNSDNVRHLPTPFGGMKASGIGRDGGQWSFDFYMETKNIALSRGNHDIPRLGI